MKQTGAILAGGLVTIGIISALFLPGRQTAQGAKAIGDAGGNLFGTVISGKSSGNVA